MVLSAFASAASGVADSGRGQTRLVRDDHGRTRCLVTGATGYIGGRLVPELLDAGTASGAWPALRSGCATTRGPAGVERVRGRRDRSGSVAASARGVEVAYYLIHALGAATASRRPTGRPPEVSPTRRRAAGVRRIVYLGGLTPAGESAVAASALPRPRSARSSSLAGAGRGAARRGHHRLRVGLLRDAALPHRAAAGDGHAALGAQPHPADRRPRRAALSRGLRGCPAR